MILAPAGLEFLAGVTGAYIIVYHFLWAFEIKQDHDAVVSLVAPRVIKIVVVPIYHARLERGWYPNSVFISDNFDSIEIFQTKDNAFYQT